MDTGQLEELRGRLKASIEAVKAKHAEELAQLKAGLTKLESVLLTQYKGSNNSKAIVQWYVELRDLKSAMSKEANKAEAEVVLVMDDIESYLIGKLNEHQVKSMATDAGTFFRANKVSCTVADRGAFISWVKEDLDARLDLVDARAAKKNIEAAKAKTEAENEEAEKQAKAAGLPFTPKDVLPPGIKWDEIAGVNVRRD